MVEHLLLRGEQRSRRDHPAGFSYLQWTYEGKIEAQPATAPTHNGTHGRAGTRNLRAGGALSQHRSGRLRHGSDNLLRSDFDLGIS
jgi:hypothetical protein